MLFQWGPVTAFSFFLLYFLIRNLKLKVTADEACR